MLRLVLRGFMQRKLRVLLTGIAIALGVALMAGTYILTDTINHAFAEVFGAAYAKKAVVVTEKETLGGSEVSVLDAATLARVRAVLRCGGRLGRHLHARGVAEHGWQAAHQRRCVRAGGWVATAALRVLHRGQGPSAECSRPGRDRRGDGAARAPAARPADRDRGSLPGAALHDRGHREVRGQRILWRHERRAARP